MTTERIVFISDLQIPYHHVPAVKSLINFIRLNADDISAVYSVGDHNDFPQPSRWNKSSRYEFESSVNKHSVLGQHVLGKIRDAYPSGPIGMVSSNHDERPLLYQQRYAPALFDDDDENPFAIQNLLRFRDYDIDFLGDHYEFHKNWILTHLHLGYSLSRYAGGTAIGAARKLHANVVGGHTHRAGIVSESFGYNGRVTSLTGIEVGHMMNMKDATYLKGGWGNWQMGFAVLDISGACVTPSLVPVQPNGSFTFGGDVYKP